MSRSADRYIAEAPFDQRIRDGLRGQNGRRPCRWCGGDVVDPKRRTFCSQRCVDELVVRKGGAWLRDRVERRDAGRCAACRIDCEAISRLAYSVKKDYYIDRHRHIKRSTIWAVRVMARMNHLGWPTNWTTRTTHWDADHIVEVRHGGGQCGLDNLQTLCLRCHRVKTSQARRSQRNGERDARMTQQ